MDKNYKLGDLKYIVIHTTASGPNLTERDIIREHMGPKSEGGNGWDRVGYSKLIKYNGRVPSSMSEVYSNPSDSIIYSFVKEREDGVVSNCEATYGVGPNYNPTSIHIAYVGGLRQVQQNGRLVITNEPWDTRTLEQKRAMRFLILYYIDLFTRLGIDVKIVGHNQIDNKACPCFWVADWLRAIGVPERFIEDDCLDFQKCHLYKDEFRNKYNNNGLGFIAPAF